MIAAQCRAGRALLDMTIRELATKANVSPKTVANFEMGRRTRQRTADAIRESLESAGVAFTNGDEPGVKIRSKR
jgi:transcriptional regulator with XRE-family HTH domain